jgi:hypothetical protein
VKRQRPDRFLAVLMRMLPLDARPKVAATFAVGRALRQGERGNGEAVKSVGVFLDMVEVVGPLWRDAAYVVAERGSPPQARP